MDVDLINNGPVTVILETTRLSENYALSEVEG
jgi:hypothetical protein